MKKIAFAAFASAAALSLAACGGTKPAADATSESVETVPEETMAATTDGATDAATAAAE
ncbi:MULTISPECIES: hypothetical protein [Novosphingobium]|jgi:ABC-type glycerol-3-phosphate transport system substrate-binding protein|uniref:Uncharacterized protein n=1 Tax=Novosphingobium clariflavum TaxID=2029884 RepID=A0ABV6S909_9SPHN|nr:MULTISPECIES: hypothetical protein [Novosphingobium]